jgi:hypothetical protein
LFAAYALVLNALLATTLLAATPASKSLTGFELCLSTDSTGHPVDASDKATKRAAVHCQLCLQFAAPAALPPLFSGLPELIPVVTDPVIAVIDLPRAISPPSLPPPSRGPPHTA